MTLIILFHLDVLPGGIVGVPVFFVISGHVITASLESRGRCGFYDRRFRRIVPELLIGAFGIGCLVTVLAPWNDGSRTAGWGLLGGANIYLVTSDLSSGRARGYLETGVRYEERNPAIHYWSLGVEEQFYMLWPFVFRRKLPAFCLMCGVCVAMSLTLPLTATYYLGPSRFWELAAGAVLVGSPDSCGVFGGACVVAGIGVAAVYPTHSFSSVLPVIGTSLLISSNDISWVYTNHMTVWLGKISYSLYLWHVPVIWMLNVLLRTPREAGCRHGSTEVMAIGISLGLAAICTAVGENVRHNPWRWTSPVLCLGAVLGSVWLLTIPPNYGAHVESWMTPAALEVGGRGIPHVSGPSPDRVLFLGDSHTVHFLPYVSARHRNFTMVAAFGKPLDLNLLRRLHRDTQTVVVSFWAEYYAVNGLIPWSIDALKDAVSNATDAGVRVFFVKPTVTMEDAWWPSSADKRCMSSGPVGAWDYPSRSFISQQDILSPINKTDYMNRVGHFASDYYDAAETAGAVLLDPTTSLCSSDMCAVDGALADAAHYSTRYVLEHGTFLDAVFVA